MIVNICAPRYRDRAKSWLGEQEKKFTTSDVNTEMFISALESKYRILCKVVYVPVYGISVSINSTKKEKKSTKQLVSIFGQYFC